MSHIHRCVLDACAGESGPRGEHIWLSALTSLYWFFDVDAVASTHLFLSELTETDAIWDVVARIEGIRKTMTIRDRDSIPL